MAIILREDELLPKFRSLSVGDAEILIAVPFWGLGASKALGLDRGQRCRVVCNLSSGACNPYEIEDLMQSSDVPICSNPRLHAKIYASANFAIVGSSNASANGLSIARVISDAWIEANVLSEEPVFVRTVCDLFEAIWSSGETHPISETELDHAKIAWDNRPKPAPVLDVSTLLETCRKYPDRFRSVFVVVYVDDISPNANKKFQNLKRQATKPTEIGACDLKNYWAYQIEAEIESGSWLVDLDYRKPKAPKIGECSQVTGCRLQVEQESDLIITLPGSIKLPESEKILLLSDEEQKAIVANAREISDYGQLVPLPEVVRIIDTGTNRRKSSVNQD
jgi:hypothetical protein